MEVNCRQCSSLFLPRKNGGKKQVYCSAVCRHEYHLRKKCPVSVSPHIPPNLNGGREATCEHCGILFTTRKRGGGRRQRYCSEKCGMSVYNAAHSTQDWENAMLKNYGINAKTYYSMLESQSGRCAICLNLPRSGRRFAVDHDHETGVVRGLLCDPCNRHLGYFEARSSAIVRYLINVRYREVLPMASPQRPA